MNTQLRNDIRGGVRGIQRQWNVVNASTVLTKRISTIAHTAAIHDVGVIVVTSTHAASLLVDDWVNVTFTTNTPLNGRYKITAVTSTTFTIAVRATVAAVGDINSDIVLLYAELPFTAATFRGQKAATITNGGDVYVGTVTPLMPDAIQPMGERVIAPTLGRYWDLGDWYLGVVTANDGLVITFD